MFMTGEDLRNMRLKAEFSTRKVAESIGVTRKTVENWEMNIGQPKLNQFLKLCILYQFNSAQLVANLLSREGQSQGLDLDALRTHGQEPS